MSAGRARAAALVGVALVLAIAARPAAAHPLDVGYLRLAPPPPGAAGFDLVLELDARTAALFAPDPAAAAAGALAPATVAALVAAAWPSAPVLTGGPAAGAACAVSAPRAALAGTTLRLAAEVRCPAAGALTWRLALVRDPRVAATFELLVKDTTGGAERLGILDRAEATLAIAGAPAPAAGFATFVASGIAHIGAAPAEWRDPAGGLRLPDGIDHVLFLLGLLLAAGRLGAMLGVATGFTVGHSVTLALATLGWLRPPAALVEPLIALTIALVAVEALRGTLGRRRVAIAVAFGLVHGFGFAAALDELALSGGALARALLGYNLGVELGQLAVVLVLAPAVLALHRWPPGRRVVVPALALAVGLAGAYWCVARVAAVVAS